MCKKKKSFRKKPIIGVLGRVVTTDEKDLVTCIWEDVKNALLKKGALPILLLPLDSLKKTTSRKTNTLKDVKEILESCDGLLLQGGYEWNLSDEDYYLEAKRKGMPILGICLGMQMMAKVDCQIKGLENENVSLNPMTFDHNQKEKKYVHEVFVEEGSLLEKIVKKKVLSVNSRHQYHVCGVKHLTISGRSKDGLIEAVEDPTKPFILGVQWHPESMLAYDKSANLIVEGFIKEARKYQQVKKR